MTGYYRVMLGRGSSHATECFEGGFIGVNFGFTQDISGQLFDSWREFNRKFVPIYLENRPERSKVAAGLACGMLWTVAKGIQDGDVILSPDGSGNYRVGN